jgi:isochorismate synthase
MANHPLPAHAAPLEAPHRPVGLRAELPRAVPASLARPSFGWSHAAADARALGAGEALRLEAQGSREAAALLGSLSRDGGVEWLDRGPLPEPPGPWFASMAFDPDSALGPGWSGFARARFVLPSLLCWSAAGRHFAAALAPGALPHAGEALRDRLDQLVGALEARRPPPPDAAPIAGSDTSITAPSAAQRAAWTALVGAALGEIRAGALAKVVVARSRELAAPAAWDPARVFESLASRHPGCRAFLVRGDDGAAFVGATPELLISIEGRELRTEAVAGSARPAEATQLLGSPKDLREHRWVVEHVVRQLAPLVERLAAPPEPGLRVLSHVAHLATPITARLRAGVDEGAVVAALHPTPAVCGEPAGAALRFLAQREGLDRGLYAGLVGLVGPQRVELAVALRSALLRGSSALLFAGAGIVEGSEAAAELRETELKMAALAQALASVAPAGGVA